MKLKLIFAFVFIVQLSYGQNLFTKGISKLSKMVGGANVATTATLDDAVLTVGIASNLPSEKLGTISQTFFPNYIGGGDQVFVMITKKKQIGAFKVDGAVTINGLPTDYVTMGMYNQITDPDPAPRKIEITTSSGQKSSFTIAHAKNKLKLISINGEKGDNAVIDLTKDVVLELEYPAEMENTKMKVSLAINQVSIKSIYDVCYTKVGKNITIPAAAFRNPHLVPAGEAVYNFKNSYLAVGTESLENATDVSGSFPVVQYTAFHSDGKFVTVGTEPSINKGLTSKGKNEQLDMTYQFFKPSAFLSRPFDHIKTIGLNSFAIRGTTFHQSSTTSTTETATQRITTTKTTTLQFPKQTDATWDALLEKLYPDFVAVLESELGSKMLPVEKVTKAESYKSVEAFAKDDVNTTVEFARAFRDTKVLSAFIPMAEGYGVNGLNERLMQESGADALLTMTLDLEISTDGKLVLMVPKFAFELVGKINGMVATTKYMTGTIQSKTGVAVKSEMTIEELENIIRKSDLLTVFRDGIRAMKEKEKANGDYLVVWDLQK